MTNDNFKFINRLVPVEEREHAGRGDYRSFVHQYREEKVLVNMDNFLDAFASFVYTQAHLYSDPTEHPVIRLTFSGGNEHSLLSVTYAEFARVFERPWTDNTISRVVFQSEE